ncbi:recombinase family protein [Aromatoleum bremense]|uniref:Recombinase family protein n=1 Tax=Aromatoleum bremense TaxID=76115 RepID=A0ABX1NY53_9RHOO|nr:recombinase family protein [Aromatoleum bremense]NMG16980.1 recombinase family protein [Aromatoleum bremense]QTQ33228.1 DNA-binding recombinase domain-containing protein [Aromatoleum bremense]
MSAVVTKKRCAVYCRVSTDERLDQSFNSIDAQREAGKAYVASQRSEGWSLVADDYLDPGFSGGNMERPGLRRLMADIEAGGIDIVIVYKIDRLTRSLTDFSRMIEVFERHKVSFVSVTQQFNTTTSMGRLMLNVLLSFAQFEREVTGERIRDKIAASKRKGMWMGGVVPLGYRVEARQLVIEPGEAKLVRRVFAQFVACRSTTDLVRALAAEKITSRRGTPFSKQGLHKILSNRLYLGEISHKGESYPGQHAALVDEALWNTVQTIFAENINVRRTDTWARRVDEALLRGLLFTADGERLQPSFTTKANGRRYRYYVPRRTLRYGAGKHPIGMLPAAPIEDMVLAQVHAALLAPEVTQAVCDAARHDHPQLTEPDIVLPLRNLAGVWRQLFAAEQQRIVQLLIERVVVTEDTLEIVWREPGWRELVGELHANTIGCELLQVEEQQEATA